MGQAAVSTNLVLICVLFFVVGITCTASPASALALDVALPSFVFVESLVLVVVLVIVSSVVFLFSVRLPVCVASIALIHSPCPL